MAFSVTRVAQKPAFAEASFLTVGIIPLVRIWAIGDDIAREVKVESASQEELKTLTEMVDPFLLPLIDWLGGEAAQTQIQNPGYQALSCLSYAVESAFLKMETAG